MTLQKNDFIELEFTGRVKDTGEVFDSNIREELEKLHSGHNHPVETKPFVFSLGQGMFLPAVDNFLIGKNAGEYTLALTPDKAFGNRDASLIQMMPAKVFSQQKVNPIPGIMFNFDGRLGKVLAVSGGRVMVDFNNPLAGKIVEYYVKVLRKIEDTNEKIKSFIEFLFRRDLKFSVEDKKLIIEAEKPLVEFVKLFGDKFKEIFSLELEVRQKAEPLANSSESQIKEIEGKKEDKDK